MRRGARRLDRGQVRRHPGSAASRRRRPAAPLQPRPQRRDAVLPRDRGGRGCAGDEAPLVIDGELVPWREGSVLDFASLQTRLGRVKPSKELLAEVPVVLVAPSTCCTTPAATCWRSRCASGEPFSTRWAFRNGRASGCSARTSPPLVRPPSRPPLRRCPRAAQRGPDGQGPWLDLPAGRRGLGWLKLKKALATLDCVVVGVEWGHGKRRGVLSDYTFAVRETSEDNGARLLTIGKASRPDRCRDRDDDRALQAITLQDHGRYRTVVPRSSSRSPSTASCDPVVIGPVCDAVPTDRPDPR